MGDVVLDAIRKGLKPEKLHLIGHSLGGQLCGYIARRVLSLSRNAVELLRITGLDPAGPGFFPSDSMQHLSAGDAKFVDIIHSDGGGYGQPSATGTADFWPNNGTRFQPGCPAGNFPQFSPEGSLPFIYARNMYL